MLTVAAPAPLTFVIFPQTLEALDNRGMISSQLPLSPVSTGQLSAAASRVQFIEFCGRRVLFIDYSHCDVAMLKSVSEEGHRVITLQPLNSVLTLNDVTGSGFDQESVNVLKSKVKDNAPFVKRAAVIGIRGLQSLIYEGVQAFSSRRIPQFPSRQEALEWLVKD